jgi:serine protease Do
MIPQRARLRVFLLLAIFSSVTWAGALSAMQRRSVLELLNVEDRLAEMAGSYEGALTVDGFHSADDRPLQAWGLVLTRGQTATVELRSTTFDAYLYVVGPGLGETLRDDDGAGGCNARVTFEAMETGMYRVVVSSLSAEDRGSYALSVTERPGPVDPSSCGDFSADIETYMALPLADRVLTAGVEVEGTLGPGDSVDEREAYVEAWPLEGGAGESVTIDLISNDFDSYLYLVGPGLSGAQSDDDGGGACHSRITVEFPEAGQ